MKQQLQTILDKTIEKWWKPWGMVPYCVDVYVSPMNVMSINFFEKWAFKGKEEYTILELFSPESGLLQAVTWKDWWRENWVAIYWGEFYETVLDVDEWQWNAMFMWTMTEEEKQKYFVDNVVI